MASEEKDIVAELRKGAYDDSLDDILMKRAADQIESLEAQLRCALTVIEHYQGKTMIVPSGYTDEDIRRMIEGDKG